MIKHTEDDQDDRSPWARAMEWTTRLTSIALEMALPGVGGHFVDNWLDTKVVFLILGVLIGFAAGMWHLILLTKRRNTSRD